MSNIIENHLNDLRQHYSDEELRRFRVESPEEKARGNVDRLYRVVEAAGSFTAYYVMGNDFHEEQHKLFCQELGIDSTPRPGSYPILGRNDHAMVLRRGIDVDEDEVVYGVSYHVDWVPYDRD